MSAHNGPSMFHGEVANAAIEMTGTTTFGAENLRALYAAHRLLDGGLLELTGQLVPEPENEADPNAIAVWVEGERIGYVPGYLASSFPEPRVVLPCQVQLWAKPTERGLRVRGWVALGLTAVRWPHSAANPPPVTTAERHSADAARTKQMIDSALAGGGSRAADFERGMVSGIHYLETVEPIKQLKREGRLEEALTLCYGAIEGAEKDRGGRPPATFYTEQAAIIHRKLGQRAEEEAVLRRWLSHCPPERRAGSDMQRRLDKLTGTA